jgi:hypothetical protein
MKGSCSKTIIWEETIKDFEPRAIRILSAVKKRQGIVSD